MPADTTTPAAKTIAHARQVAAELAAGHPQYQGVPRDQLLGWQREQATLWAINLEGVLARYVPGLLKEHDRLTEELDEARDRIADLERRRSALLEGMTRSDEAALRELERVRPQPGAADRVEASLQHVYSVLGDRAPSDIDIEALTADAPWWLELRDAVDDLAGEVRRYTERAPTGHAPDPAPPDGVDLSQLTQARRGGLAVLLAAHRAGAPVYRANTTTAPWEAPSRAAAGRQLYVYRGISDWLGVRELVQLVQRGKDNVLQLTDRGRQLAEYLEAAPPDTGGAR